MAAQSLYLSGERAIYTPRHFSPAAPRVKTKLICGRIVKVLDDDESQFGPTKREKPDILVTDTPRPINYNMGTELSAPYHTQPGALPLLPKLPPIESPKLAERLPDLPRDVTPLDRLYSLLPPDGTLPVEKIKLTDDDLLVLRYYLSQHLQSVGSEKMMEIYEKLQQQRRYNVPLDEVQEALTRNMVLIPPPLLKLAASLFIASNQPGSVELEKLVSFLADSANQEQLRLPATDSWTKFPAELIPVVKMLPRHGDVPYESILLRPNEKSALMGHLNESLADMEPSLLKDVYHELSRKDREMTGCLPFEDVKEAFELRSASSILMPIILRLLACMHISRRHVGEVDYRSLLRFIDESLGTDYTPGPPAMTLPPPPPNNLLHLLRLLPKNTDLPSDSILLRENDKAELIRHVKGLMSMVSDEEIRNLHIDLAQCDRSLNGAIRYQDLARVFVTKKINFSPEILRLAACLFISAKAPGHVDYKKFMMFLAASQKGIALDVTVGPRESTTLDGLPYPPAAILPLLRELPKQVDKLTTQPISLSKDEQREVLSYLENHIHEFDPIAIEGMYSKMEGLDRDGRRYIHYSCLLDEIVHRKLPLHPMIVRLLACMCSVPNTDSCVKYGKFLAFLGLALKRMPRIPELMDSGSPPSVNPAITALFSRLPRRGLPERVLVLTDTEQDEVRSQLATLLSHATPEQIMTGLEEFISMDKRGAGIVSLDNLKAVLGRAKISLPDRLIDLIAAMFVSPYYPDQVDFKEFLAFIDAAIADGTGRRPFKGVKVVPESLLALTKLMDSYADLPYEPLKLSELQRVQITKYLSDALTEVTSDDLNTLYDDLLKNDQYHEGAVPSHQIQSTVLRHRIPIHKDILRVISAMFVQTKQMPHQVVDIKRFLMFLGSAVKSAGPIDGDLPQQHQPGAPPPPPGLLKVLRSLPPEQEMPSGPVVLSESEKACLQEHLRALMTSFSTDNFKSLYNRMSETDRYNAGTLPFNDLNTVLQQFGIQIPPEIIKLTAAMFITDKFHGRCDYAKLIVFLNATINAASNKDLMELTRRYDNPNNIVQKTIHEPEMMAVFRLLPPYYELPLDSITMTDKEREIVLEDIRKNVWPLDKNTLKILYQQLATMDSRSLSYLPFEDIKRLFRTKGVSIDSDVLRLISSQFVSNRMKGYVKYEDLINFLNEALKSPKLILPSDDPIGVRADLPPALTHIVTLLPDREPLPKAPLFLKESERTMLAEAIHDVLGDFDDQNLTQLHAELVRLDTGHIRTLSYADILQALIKFNLRLPLDVARLLMAQFMRDEGRIEYKGMVDFLKAALKHVPDLPSSRDGYISNRDLPPQKVQQGKIRPLHGREDVALVRQIVRILSENVFDPERLKDAFVSADTRRNGTLSAVQIKNIAKLYGAPLSESIYDRVFEHLDYMGVGQFSWSQFVEFLQRCLDRATD